MKIGILAVQGNFEAHAKVLASLNVSFHYVTKPKDLNDISALILPGGESTTMLKFLAEDNFFETIKHFAEEGHHLFGTCAGAILLANEVINPSQTSLKLIDITLERNAYGRQLSSYIGTGCFDEQKNIEMVFIRAPKIIKMNDNVKVFATFQGQPVGVMTEHVMLTTFHPELTSDQSIHQLFISRCAKQ